MVEATPAKTENESTVTPTGSNYAEAASVQDDPAKECEELAVNARAGDSTCILPNQKDSDEDIKQHDVAGATEVLGELQDKVTTDTPMEEDDQEDSEQTNMTMEQEIVAAIQPLPLHRGTRNTTARSRSGIHSQVGAIAIGGPSSFHSVGRATTTSMRSSATTHTTSAATGALTANTNEDPLVEAQLVEEGRVEQAVSNEPTPELVVAEELGSSTNKARLICRGLQVGAVTGLAALFITLIVLFVSNKDNDEKNACFMYTEQLYNALDAVYENPLSTSPVALQDGDSVGLWCVSGITHFTGLFYQDRYKLTISKQGQASAQNTTFDLSLWDMSQAQDLTETFRGVKTLSTDWGLQDWNTSQMINLKSTFMATGWTDPTLNLSTWDVSQVRYFDQLFRRSDVTDPGISAWDTSSSQDMTQLAEAARNFNPDLSKWNVAQVKSLNNAFHGAFAFQSDLSGWNVSNVQSMNAVFENAISFNYDLRQWDVSQVTTMMRIFKNATSFNSNLSQWDVSSVIDLNGAFQDATSFNQDLCAWRHLLSNDTVVANMFVNTACPNTSDPVLPDGPFCYNCD